MRTFLLMNTLAGPWLSVCPELLTRAYKPGALILASWWRRLLCFHPRDSANAEGEVLLALAQEDQELPCFKIIFPALLRPLHQKQAGDR